MLAPLSPTAVPVHRIPQSSWLTAALVPRILRLSLRMVALGRRIPRLSLHNWPNAEARTTDVVRACNVDRTPRRSDHVMVKLALINSKQAVLVHKGHRPQLYRHYVLSSYVYATMPPRWRIWIHSQSGLGR